jgi:hypothetical protein
MVQRIAALNATSAAPATTAPRLSRLHTTCLRSFMLALPDVVVRCSATPSYGVAFVCSKTFSLNHSLSLSQMIPSILI